MNVAERYLKLLLRVVGVFGLAAIVPVFMPHSWLVRGVELAEPGTRVHVLIPYLARLVSAYYVLLGGMLLIFSTDVRRYAGPIRLVALWSLVAVAAFVIHSISGLVKGGLGWFIWFVASDVAFGFAFAVAILLLQWRIAENNHRQASNE